MIQIKKKYPDATPREIVSKLGYLWSKIKNTSKADKYKV